MSVEKDEEKLVLIKYKSKYDRVRMSNFSKNIGESLKLNVWRFTNGSDLTPISDLIVDSIGESTQQLQTLYRIFANHAMEIAPYFEHSELFKINEIKFVLEKKKSVDSKGNKLIVAKTKNQELLKKFQDLKNENESLKERLGKFE